MAYTSSKLVVHTKLSPNHSGQRTHSIDRISPHCVVGQVTAESLGNLFARASYQASSNYGIDKDGRVGLYVEEKNRSWCTSSSANDQRAVTIECASDTSSPYRMNDVVYQTLVGLCADICRRNGKKKLLWFGDKNKTLNYSPASDEMVITVHRWFANKSCPGDWLYSRLGDLAQKVTAELGDATAPAGTEVMLVKGDRGGAVEEMQKMLIACGYSCGSCGADGIFGNDTLKAVEAFQRAAGLSVDGIYGPKSKAALTAKYQNRGKTDAKPYTEAFIEKVAPLAQADQKAKGILASITLAQAILESGWGRSELAVNANNLFGMKKSLSGNTWTGSTWDGKSVYSKETKEVYASGPATVQADFRAYKSWQDSVSDHSAYLLGARKGSALRYEGLKGCADHRKAAQIIKDGGYATSPTYVDKLCSIIGEWKLTQYDVMDTPTKKEEKPDTAAMAITIYVPGFTTSRSDERHGDGMVIHSESGQTLVIDGFDGGAPTKSLISYLKKHNYKELHLMLSHPHYDHYKGLRMIMADSFFSIKTFFCYDPDSIKHGIGSSANGRSVKEDYDNLNACINQAKGRGATIDYLDTGRYVVLGDIEFKVWRKQPTHFTDLDDGNAYAFTNDGSLCCYFSKLRFLTTGDGPTDLKEAIAYFGDKVYVLKVPHHGNSCSKSNAQAARNAGCVIAFETNIESKGPGTTDFTAYGARRLIEQGVKVLMQNKDIIMTASGGKLTVRQGGSTWTFDVPYDGKPAQLYRVRKSWSNVNSQIGAYSILANAKAAADKAGSAYGVFDWNGKEVYRASGVKDPYLVRVTKVMDIRKGPGTSLGKAERKCPAGIFTIVEVKGDWGRLKSGAGWIQLSKTEKI